MSPRRTEPLLGCTWFPQEPVHLLRPLCDQEHLCACPGQYANPRGWPTIWLPGCWWHHLSLVSHHLYDNTRPMVTAAHPIPTPVVMQVNVAPQLVSGCQPLFSRTLCDLGNGDYFMIHYLFRWISSFNLNVPRKCTRFSCDWLFKVTSSLGTMGALTCH